MFKFQCLFAVILFVRAEVIYAEVQMVAVIDKFRFS